MSKLKPLCLTIVTALWISCVAASQEGAGDSSNWKSFSSRAGWSIKYPGEMKVGSCRQCEDPTDPTALVTFASPQFGGSIMVERLADKPAGRSVDSWLHEVSRNTVAGRRANEEWIYLDGVPALRVENRDDRNSLESENLYVVSGLKTFAIRAADSGQAQFHRVFRQMLSTFRFTG